MAGGLGKVFRSGYFTLRNPKGDGATTAQIITARSREGLVCLGFRSYSVLIINRLDRATAFSARRVLSRQPHVN